MRILRIVAIAGLGLIVLMGGLLLWNDGASERAASRFRKEIRPGMTLRQVCERVEGNTLCTVREPGDPRDPVRGPIVSQVGGSYTIRLPGRPEERYARREEFLSALDTKAADLATLRVMRLMFFTSRSSRRCDLTIEFDAEGRVREVGEPVTWK